MLKFTDARGALFFPVKTEDGAKYKQTTVSCNKKNVFRGIHINDFEKRVTCVHGKILDIVVDMDTLQASYYLLDPSTDQFQVDVPKGHGHAFLSLEENSIVVYHLAGEFTPETTTTVHYLDPHIGLVLPVSNADLILSENDRRASFVHVVCPIDYLVFGYKGFIGSHMVAALQAAQKHYQTTDLRLQHVGEIAKLLDTYKPKYVLNCAGITGTPNIFWCDEHKAETVENNVLYQLTLAGMCKERGIHLTMFGSAGIFSDNQRMYAENDVGDNRGTFYGECRLWLEHMVRAAYLNTVLYLRVNYPISTRKSGKNLLTKLVDYKEITDCEMSVSYLDDLLPILLKMVENGETGVCNFTNPGTIKLTDILLEMGEEKKRVLPEKTDEKRTFARLQTGKLASYGPLQIKEGVKECVRQYISLTKTT